MSDTTTLAIAFILLIGCILLTKNDFKNWSNMDAKDKFYTLRGPIILVFGIIILIIKITRWV